MCGIAGIVNRPNGNQALQAMLNVMRHRGPDDSGIYTDDQATIGMNRLSILDLSPLGHQPMQSHCKRYWIVYNGECYNYQHIRKKLEREGDQFISNSDTEVVLQAYVRWGTDCLQEMNGMFAFAIWDTLEKKLFAARDRLGIKPFYYSIENQSLVFASELKAILASGEIPFEVDPLASHQYFWFGHAMQPATIIKNVKALMPGHFLTFSHGQLQILKYWSLENIKETRVSYNDAKDLLLQHLDRSVAQQLISDRPLGLFLSGGLDSATVLACMVRAGTHVNSFSLGFAENRYAKSEEQEAVELANYFGTKHEQITIEGKEVADEIESFFKVLDQPSVDGLNTYLVSKYAIKHMTVALSGLGGDELFGGYTRQALLWWKYNNRKGWLAEIADFISPDWAKNERILRLKAHLSGNNILLNYTVSRSGGAINKPDTFLDKNFLKYDYSKEYFETFKKVSLSKDVSPLNRILALDVNGYMEPQLLRDMDVLSMAHSLEVRVPLIDHELTEFAFSLPAEYRLPVTNTKPATEGQFDYAGGNMKQLLLDTMLPFLPPGFERRKKNGFKLPIGLWLRKELKEFAMDLLQDELNNSIIIKRSCLEKQIQDIHMGTGNYWESWKIIAFLGALKGLKIQSNR